MRICTEGVVLVDITTTNPCLLNVHDNVVGVFENRLRTFFDSDVFGLA